MGFNSFHELSHQNFNCSYGWRWGFLSLAGFAFLGCAAGGVMSKVERPYSPSTHVPEPEVEQPMGVKARVLGTLLHPQLYARFLPRSIILKFTLFFQSCSWTLLVGVPRRRGCYPESLHSVPLRSLHCKRPRSDSNPGSYAYICDWRLFYGWSVSS